MKKTLTVNISGIVFHIDEDAYRVLNDYLQSLKKHFSRTKGGDEIVSDIEARIAEMLKERIGDDRQVITIDDIEEVIEVIGQPSEFGEEFADDTSSSSSSYSQKGTKRLYRDPDKAMLGGVCTGLGAYFRTDPVWFRLAFVLLSIPGIGTPLLIYVVLWIILPEAQTAADRLEMKGEKINISNIEDSIREEINNLKNKFNDLKKGARSSYKKKSEVHRSDFEGVGNALGKVAELFVKLVLIFAGILLFVIGISFVVALLAGFFGFGHDIFIVDSELVYVSFHALVNFFLGSLGSNALFKIAILLLVGIPIVMIIYAGVKLIFGLQRTRFVGISALNIWLIALVVTVFYGVKVFRSFSHSGVHEEITKQEVPVNNLINLQMKENEKFNRYYRYEEYFDIDEANMIITNDADDFFYGVPQLEIVKSRDEHIEVVLYYRAKGKSNIVAENRAQQILYNYSIADSELVFDQFFKLPEREIWREQQIDIVVKVPEGCRIYIHENMQPIINDYYHSPYRLSGDTWIMTDSGLEETEPVPENQFEETEDEEIQIKQEGDNSSASVSFVGIFYNSIVRLLGYQV